MKASSLARSIVVVMATTRTVIVNGFTPLLKRGLPRSTLQRTSSQAQAQIKASVQRRSFARFRWSNDFVRLHAIHDDLKSTETNTNDNSITTNVTATFPSAYNGEPSDDSSNNNSNNNSTISDSSAAPPSMNETETAPDSLPLAELTSILAIDPRVVDIVTLDSVEPAPSPEEAAKLFSQLPFVHMFRGSANYIANHRNTLAVYHIPGDLMDLQDPGVFRDLMNDVALTWLLGMKIVIVVGCRYQIEKRMPNREKHFGMTITDREVLRVVKEEAGYVRFEVERQLARSLRMQGAVDGSSSSGDFDGNVVSGNFYSAQPFGILDGIDYKYSGFVRRVEVEKIRQVHQSRDIVLLTTLGVSPSGEVFNVNSESLAATVAGSLGASKIIFFTEKEVELRHKEFGNKIQHLRVNDGRNLLDLKDIKIHKRGFVNIGEDAPEEKAGRNMLIKVGWSMHALEQGVKRAHIISPKFGALLQELYTRDGSGTMISRDLYDGIRQARVEDVSCIYDLISPLIQMGTLVDRPKAVLEKSIEQYHVFTRDNLVVACGQLKMFENGFAEIGCLVVNPEYRSAGRGDAMLGYLERMCVQKGASVVFVLSTQTMEWFLERGFDETRVEMLPPTRQAMYNHNRASKIYLKKIDSIRDLDASELWWNR
jgi:amino-acid N-acetyltransferase